MREYRVVWEIDVTADNPVEAAKDAIVIMRDPDSTATFFTVIPHDDKQASIDVDLEDQP